MRSHGTEGPTGSGTTAQAGFPGSSGRSLATIVILPLKSLWTVKAGPQRMFTSIFHTEAHGSSGNISTVTEAGPCGFPVTAQGFPPGTAQTHFPSRKLAANDAGVCCCWPVILGRRQRDASSQVQSEPANSDLGSQTLRISVQARNTRGTTTSDKGDHRASEHAIQPCRGGGPLMSGPMRKLQSREGPSPWSSSSKGHGGGGRRKKSCSGLS